MATPTGCCKKWPPQFPLYNGCICLLCLVEARIIKRKSPVPQDPGLLAEKEILMAELRARERTLAFLSETERHDLRQYCWQHPFLCMLSAYEWMEMIAAHQIRYTKQMREIEETLSRKL